MYLWKINAESIHVHSIQEACKAFIEPAQALVHQLQMHEIGFQIGHGVRKLGESWLKELEGEG